MFKKSNLFILVFLISLFGHAQNFLLQSTNLIPKQNNKGKYGYVNLKGKKVIDYQFDYAERFSEGFAIVGIDNKFMIIDQNGEILAKDTFDLAWTFQSHYSLVMKNMKYAYIDTVGKVLNNQWFDKASLVFENYGEASSGNTNYLIWQGQVMNYGNNKLSRMSAEVNDFVSEMPRFPGGMENFMNYFQNNLKISGGDNSATVTSIQVSFIIERDGTISAVQLLDNSNSEIEQKVIQILMKMPPWNPGKQNGVAVRVKYNLPLRIDFQ